MKNLVPHNREERAELMGAIFTVITVLLLSEKIYMIGFIAGIISNVFWMVAAHELNSKWLYRMNIVLMLLNVNGIVGLL
jgi:hypothetical protein